ncbi:MAG: hypothetical protein R3D03_21955 [Geminicoccaceae bacterium]
MRPGIFEHAARHVEQSVGRAQAFQQIDELAFQRIAADGFPIAGATFGRTEIVRMLPARLAGRPAGRQRLTAIVAEDEAAKGKILADVPAGRSRSLGAGGTPLLYLLEGRERDQRFVVPLHPVDVPVRVAEKARIDRTGQQPRDFLLANGAVTVLREGGLAFEEALDLGLTVQTAGGIAFKSVGDDARHRFVGYQQFSVGRSFGIAIADRRLKHPIAVLHPGTHFLRDLPPVLLALQGPLRCQNGLDELALGTVVELEIQAFDAGLAGAERLSELQVKLGVAGKALEIIEDDDIAFAGLRIEIAQKSDHARTLHEVAAAGDIIGKHGLDRIAVRLRIFPATGFLRFEPVTVANLFLARHAAIDDGGLLFSGWMGQSGLLSDGSGGVAIPSAVSCWF